MTYDNKNIQSHEADMRLIRVIARQFSNNPATRQDLMQEGYIDLIEAAKRYFHFFAKIITLF